MEIWRTHLHLMAFFLPFFFSLVHCGFADRDFVAIGVAFQSMRHGSLRKQFIVCRLILIELQYQVCWNISNRQLLFNFGRFTSSYKSTMNLFDEAATEKVGYDSNLHLNWNCRLIWIRFLDFRITIISCGENYYH